MAKKLPPVEPEYDGEGSFADPTASNAQKIEKTERPQYLQQGESSKLGILLFFFFGVVLLGASLVGLLLWVDTPVEAKLISLPIEDYSESWPVNPWASNDSTLLAAHFIRARDNNKSSIASEFTPFQDASKIREVLDWLKGQAQINRPFFGNDLASRPLVLHISAHGVALSGSDPKQERVPYIIPINAERTDPWNWPKESSTASRVWIELEEVINAMNACQSPNKLLLLDLAHPVQDAFLGPIRNPISQAIDELLSRLETEGKLKFPVLVSTGGKDQVSWPLDKEKCSVFAYYIAEALKGKADGYADGVKTRRISAKELAEFVTLRVTRFVQKVYDENQTPKLYGMKANSKEDFPLTISEVKPEVKQEPKPESEPPPKKETDEYSREKYPTSLDDWWRARASRPSLNMYLPVEVSRITGALLRREEYWLHGSDATYNRRGLTEFQEKAADYWRNRVKPGEHITDPYLAVSESLLNEMSKYRLGVKLPVPPSTAKDPKDEKTANKPAGLNPYLQALSRDPTKLKPEELDKLRPAWDEAVATNPREAAEQLWKWSTMLPWTDDHRVRLKELVESLMRPVGREGLIRAELVLLQRVAAWNICYHRGTQIFPSNELQRLLQIEDQFNTLYAIGPEGFWLVERDVADLEKLRTQLRQSYFRKENPGREFEVIVPEQIRVTMQKIQGNLKKWREANRELRELCYAVHDNLSAVLNVNETPSDADWKFAIDAAVALQNAVTSVEQQGSLSADGLAQLELAASAARDATLRLRKGHSTTEITTTLKKLIGRKDPVQAKAIVRLVLNTAAAAEKRGDHWEQCRKEHESLVDEIIKSDKAEDDPLTWKMTPKLAALPARPDVQSSRLVQVSMDVARLTGQANLDELLAKGQQALGTDKLELLETFAKASEIFWLTALLNQTKEDLKENRWFKVHRVLQSLPPDVLRTKKGAEWLDLNNPNQQTPSLSQRIVDRDAEAFRRAFRLTVEQDRMNLSDGMAADPVIQRFYENFR